MLVESYRRLRHSLVAFIPRFAPDISEAAQFPPIIGTGFVVHETGLIATNDHVVQAIGSLPYPKDFKEIPAAALFFVLTDKGMACVPIDVVGVIRISKFSPSAAYYGPAKPDIAFVQVKASGLLPVRLRSVDTLYEEGEEIATAGFPMGTDHLRAPGWVHQLSPTLQTGIISAVHPFPCATPHGFTINVMVQGGASGSPIFNRDTGEVIGAVYAGLYDFMLEMEKRQYRVPTNYTYGVPSHYLVNFLPSALEDEQFKSNLKEAKPISKIFSEANPTNPFTGEAVGPVKLPWSV